MARKPQRERATSLRVPLGGKPGHPDFIRVYATTRGNSYAIWHTLRPGLASPVSLVPLAAYEAQRFEVERVWLVMACIGGWADADLAGQAMRLAEHYVRVLTLHRDTGTTP